MILQHSSRLHQGIQTLVAQATVAAYQVQSGVDTSTFGNGWGAGTWSRGAWNSREVNVLAETLRLWQHDTFGEDLILCTRWANILLGYIWQCFAKRYIFIKLALTSASNTPLVAKQVMVSDVDRHVIAFGCNPI